MRKPFPRLAGLLLLVALGAAGAAEDPVGAWRVDRPFASDSDVDWLAVAPERLAAELAPLLAHREASGLRVGLVTTEELRAATAGAEPEQDAGELLLRGLSSDRHPPRYLLLTGDTDSIPNRVVDGVPTDHPFAAPHDTNRIETAVGRLPARAPAELRTMVRKTLALERRAPELWRRELAIFGGVGGFRFDPLLEAAATEVLSRVVPDPYRIDVTYGSPQSPYHYPPPAFAEHLVERIREGPLLVVFVGHGSPSGTQRLSFRGRSFPILDGRVADAIGDAAPVGFVAIACSTGAYHRKADSIGERLLKRPTGVTWFLGSSLPSAPYGNARLGAELARTLLDPDGLRTVGAAVAVAKSRLLGDRLSRALGRLSAPLTGVSPSGDEIREHVLLYNLLGDPAIRIPRPRPDLSLAAAVDAAGATVVAGAGAPSGVRVLVTVETGRTVVRDQVPVPPETDPEYGDVVRRNHARANDRVVLRAAVEADAEGRFATRFAVPLAPGPYVVKAAAVAKDDLLVGSAPLAAGR